MKRPSKKVIAEFIALQIKLIEEAGGKPASEHAPYTHVINIRWLSSKHYTKLYIKPFGDWIACKFEDAEDAFIRFSYIAGYEVNRFSGKCNFHDPMSAVGSLEFENFLLRVTGREQI